MPVTPQVTRDTPASAPEVRLPMATFGTLDEADRLAAKFNADDPDTTYEARAYHNRYALWLRDEDGFDLGWL